MAAHGRKGKAHGLRQLAGPMQSLAQEIDHAPTIGIGQGGQRAIEAGRFHGSLPNLNPVALSISSVETLRTGCEKVQ